MALYLLSLAARMQSRDAIMGWLGFIEAHKSPRTLTLYRMVVWRFMDSLPPKIRLHNITREHIERHLALLTVCNRSINTYSMVLRSFFAFYEDRFSIPNPTARLKRLPETPPHQRVLSEAEYHRILEVCNQQERAVIELLANTGLRSNLEFAQALNPANIADDMLHTINKGNRAGVTPLNHTAKAAIEILLSHIDFSKSIARRNSLYYLCVKLAKRAEIPKFTPHSLRYYFGDSLRRKKVSIFEISKLYHHSTVKQTMAYLHLDEDELKGLTDVLDKPAENG